MLAKLTASIVIYKSNLQQLQKAVESFLNSTGNSLLYLIDNSPSEQIGNTFNHPRIEYIFNNKNIGFGAAHNLALTAAIKNGSTYHLVLNPDVYFDSNVVHQLCQFMENDPTVGLVMPKVLYPDGRLQPLCKLLPSPSTLFIRRFMHLKQSWTDRLNHYYEMHFSGYNKVMDVPFLSGCFMFLRVDALKKIGLFDEGIFLYTEDADLSRRIHQHYRTVFNPEVTIYHYNQRRSYKNVVSLMHHVLSAITYFNKWGWFNDQERKFINQKILLKFSQ